MRRALLSFLLLAACGGSQHPAPRADAGSETTHADPPPLPSDRALAADATFGDLVAATVHEDDMRASDSDAGCLLRATASGYELSADLSVAVRGLPEAPSDLASRVEASGRRARVLTRLGSYGASSPLVAVALTTIGGVARRTGVLLVLTARGVFVVPTGAAGESEPVDAAAAVSRVASLGVASVFVTADAHVPLRDVASLLAALDAASVGHVALATVLPEDAVAPDEATPTDGAAPLCDGLPALPDDAPIGELDPADLRAALSSSLVPSAQACVATSASGLGGLVRVAFRIGEDGRVSDACVTEDGAGDATLRACLVDALRALVFPHPAGGSVDVELPLRLDVAEDPAHHQRGVCSP